VILASLAVAAKEPSSVAVANATALRKATAVLINPNLAPMVTTASRADIVQLARLHVPVQQSAIIPRHKSVASKAAVYGAVPSTQIVVVQDITTFDQQNNFVRMDLV
jgi:hypothetical protein